MWRALVVLLALATASRSHGQQLRPLPCQPPATTPEVDELAPALLAPQADDEESGGPTTPEIADDISESPKKWFEKYRIRGYSQLRISEILHHQPGTAPPDVAGDASISDNQNFLLRRARVILSGDVSDFVSIYIQPDFVVTPPGSNEANHFVQLRDWYADVYFDLQREYRVRVGQSKVPYGWENMQSSSNRAPFDRNDAFNSAVRNERELGAFFYWTPTYAQEIFEFVLDEGLKGSGNYGVFGLGVYNGQGGSFQEQNDTIHLVTRLTLPHVFDNGQIVEVGMQGYVGKYVVTGVPIRPLGQGPVDVIPIGTLQQGNRAGLDDQRLGWSWIIYPQPLGLQAEWTIGRGPALDASQTELEIRSLNGGYVMALYRLENHHGIWFPYTRWSYYRGGYKFARNAPLSYINEVELGVEWQIRPECELTFAYLFTDRTNLDAISGTGDESYRQFVGQVLRAQFQVNY